MISWLIHLVKHGWKSPNSMEVLLVKSSMAEGVRYHLQQTQLRAVMISKKTKLVDDLLGDFTNQQYLGDNQNHKHLPPGNLRVCELEHWPCSSMIYRLLEGI